VACIAAVVAWFGLEPAIRFFSSGPEVVKAALVYGYIRLFFLPVFFATFACFTALRCTGDPASQMWIMIGVSALNALLAPVFMPLFGLMSGGGTIVGQNLGAGNVERAAATARRAALFPEPVLRLFLNEPEAIAG
jgi:Na+-driven multidrug efflux pump